MVDIPLLVRRADAYRNEVGRTSGGISKVLFDDVRTLDLLRDPTFKSITIERLEQAEDRLNALFAALHKKARA